MNVKGVKWSNHVLIYVPSWHLPGEAGEEMSLSDGGNFLNQGSNHAPPERK
jgi:hypothetical protein